jgi:hypothetical protein
VHDKLFIEGWSPHFFPVPPFMAPMRAAHPTGAFFIVWVQQLESWPAQAYN